MKAPTRLSGKQKAAILLVSLRPDVSSEIFKHLKEEEIEDLVRGVDIVVATPARARAVYLKLGLNLNRIQTFVIDDAEEIVKQGMQTTVRELAQSCGKVQYLAFSTVIDEKLHLMIDDFMPFAAVVELAE